MRLGFIGGCGHHYLRGLLGDPETAPDLDVAFSGDGGDDAAARDFAETMGRGSWFDAPSAMLDAFRPEVVSVGAVYGLNGDRIAEALERGAAVSSDKPIAATWEQLGRLRKIVADRGGVRLVTELPFRCRAEFRAARDAVAAGLIGDVVLATAQKSYRFGVRRPAWYADRASYAGTMLWVASHGVDAIGFVAGRRIVRAIGRQGNVSKPEYGRMEDHCVALCELEGGATGLVHADFLRPAAAATHGDDRLRVAGSTGVIEVRDARCKLVTADRPEEDITDRAESPPMHREILRCLQGEPTDLCDTSQSLELAAVLLACRDAADEQCAVDVPVP